LIFHRIIKELVDRVYTFKGRFAWVVQISNYKIKGIKQYQLNYHIVTCIIEIGVAHKMGQFGRQIEVM
jgi:hypothetical protein